MRQQRWFYLKQRESAIKLQAAQRCHSDYTKFKTQKAAAINIQRGNVTYFFVALSLVYFLSAIFVVFGWGSSLSENNIVVEIAYVLLKV